MDWSATKRRVKVNGLEMAYVERGEGDPIVLLHGNPTSSFLWRNIIPHLESSGRCIAPDLIGMGDSDKLPNSGPGAYSLEREKEFIFGFFDALGLKDRVTLVLHDWGSALGFLWAKANADAVRGVAFMEPVCTPWQWSDLAKKGRQSFEAMRSPAGEQMVLQDNKFIEFNLPFMVMRQLTEAEMSEYRRPFLMSGEARRVMLDWPRQIPFDGEPPEVAETLADLESWLSASTLPKLFIDAEPGAASERLTQVYRSWPNQEKVAVRGLHYPQEDSPEEIGTAIAQWLAKLP